MKFKSHILLQNQNTFRNCIQDIFSALITRLIRFCNFFEFTFIFFIATYHYNAYYKKVHQTEYNTVKSSPRHATMTSSAGANVYRD